MNGAALVTGARRGIGKAIAIALADSGYDVALCDLEHSDDLETAVGVIRAKGRKSIAIAGSISKIEDHARMRH